ncbi:MAG: alginate lyase family protein [Desulfobacteraceae bacterium]|nr:alginate lyase family protein [Desulfobacteraceae bacterium]
MNEPRIKFYLNRLKNASFAEIAHRMQEKLTLFKLRQSLRTKGLQIKVPSANLSDIQALRLPTFSNSLGKSIDKEIDRGSAHFFNADSYAGKPVPDLTHLFFADIDYKKLPFDIRSLWERGRLQHILPLLLSKQQQPSANSKTVGQLAKSEVFKWIDNNPFPYGPHYLSAMECGMRIPVFFCCLKLVDDLSALESASLMQAIYLHAWWISRRLSLYSSLGNHTIAECVGLIFAGAVFRKTKAGEYWLNRSLNLLKKELEHQILEDGGPAEQSLNYHRFVLDLYWLAVDFLKKNNLCDCSGIVHRLILGENFITCFQDDSGNIPSIGDSDDGYAVAPGVAPKRPEKPREKSDVNVFRYSGYTVINSNKRVLFTFDHGPLGMPPLYNHGHADALSITLAKGGKQILVDPGTYRYNGVPKWRRYFKGTKAHNTVTIDGFDQAIQETSFIWSRPYEAKLTRHAEKNGRLILEGVHDGYARLRRPVWHKRFVLYFGKRNFLIRDSFWGEGIHDFELLYHLHPEASVTNKGGWWLIDNQGASVLLKLATGDEFAFVQGQKDPLLGWYSPSYGTKMESGVLTRRKRGSPGRVSFLTVICTGDHTDLEMLQEDFLL